MSGKSILETPQTITREEIRAVYHAQASFILSASGSGPCEDLLGIFDMVNFFYHHWSIRRIARVETSIKVCGKGVFRRRYAVPVNPHFTMDEEMMVSMVRCMNPPSRLLDLITRRHGARIRMGVGIDHDNGIKKVYFSEGEEKIYAYGFRENGEYGEKAYRILREGNHGEVMFCIRDVFGPDTEVGDASALFAQEGRYIVYDRFALEDGRERAAGYHISPPLKKKIADIKGPLMQMALFWCPGLDEQAFYDWIYKTASGYLFWIGLGKDRHGGAEMSLYVRNIDC